MRDSTRIDSCAAKSRPRMRSASDSETSSATDGTTLTRVTKWVNSARSLRTTPGSAPMSYCSRSSLSAAATSPFISASNRSTTRTRSARPSICRTSSARTGPAAWAMRLIEQRQRVAHRAFGGARDQRQRRRLGLDVFLGGDAFEMLDQQRGIDAAQIEALAARQHRHRHLADFGGGEDELGVRRRLFQRLEQRVERGARQHVHFVEDIDLVARATPAHSGWRR